MKKQRRKTDVGDLENSVHRVNWEGRDRRDCLENSGKFGESTAMKESEEL